MLLNIAQTVRCTEAEGPGRRFAIWFQGCPLRCSGCCNPEMLPFEGGEQIESDDLLAEIWQSEKQDSIEGITLLGGEPFAHAAGSIELCRAVREAGLSVMIFSGYSLQELHEMTNPEIAELLSLTDLLVDGRYEKEQPETHRRWIGSSNQQIRFLSNRYSPLDPCWQESNTLEIRMENGELSINGFPAPEAVGVWKRLR